MGKQLFLKELIAKLRGKGYRIGGILAEGFWNGGSRDRFELVDLRTNDRILYCQRKAINDWPKIRHFYVNPKGIEFGEKALLPSNLEDTEIIAIDEIGPFEMDGKGWANALKRISEDLPDHPMIWTVRSALLEPVKNYFLDNPPLIIDISVTTIQEEVEKIIRFFKLRHQ